MMPVLLTQGLVAIVDDADFDSVSAHVWRALKCNKRFYAGTAINGRIVMLHRFLLCAQPGQMVDHANGASLDNRRANLRFATYTQNNQNVPKITGHARGEITSSYKGVAVTRPNSGKWRVRISVEKKTVHLGVFCSEIEAARAYDTAAKQFFGPFARLNFPEHSFSPPTHLSAETNKCLPACGKVFP